MPRLKWTFFQFPPAPILAHPLFCEPTCPRILYDPEEPHDNMGGCAHLTGSPCQPVILPSWDGSRPVGSAFYSAAATPPLPGPAAGQMLV
jgi:hypothetical protein